MRFRQNEGIVLGVGLQHSFSCKWNNVVGSNVVLVLFIGFFEVYETLCDVCLFLDSFACATIATGWECQGATLRPDGKVQRMERSMNEIPSKMPTARYGAA